MATIDNSSSQATTSNQNGGAELFKGKALSEWTNVPKEVWVQKLLSKEISISDMITASRKKLLPFRDTKIIKEIARIQKENRQQNPTPDNQKEKTFMDLPLSNWQNLSKNDWKKLVKAKELKQEDILNARDLGLIPAADASNLIKEFKKILTKQIVGNDLIPIKGISKVMQQKLRPLHIVDIPTLLTYGQTKVQRYTIARELGVNQKLVNSWVEQADLWRIPSMTTDTASLLVQIGVRSVEDLSKVDAAKAYPIMQRLSDVQPDFVLEGIQRIYELIKKARSLYAVSKNFYQLEVTGSAPTFLFIDSVIDKTEINDNFKVIEEGVSRLSDVANTLPLPHTIKGSVEIKGERVAYSTVELKGVLSPSGDMKPVSSSLACTTNDEGRFSITMPDKYSLRETLSVLVTVKGAKIQRFIFTKSASDVLKVVMQTELKNRGIDIDKVIENEKNFYEAIQKIKDIVAQKNAEALKLIDANDVQTIQYYFNSDHIDINVQQFLSDKKTYESYLSRLRTSPNVTKEVLSKINNGDAATIAEMFKECGINMDAYLFLERQRHYNDSIEKIIEHIKNDVLNEIDAENETTIHHLFVENKINVDDAQYYNSEKAYLEAVDTIIKAGNVTADLGVIPLTEFDSSEDDGATLPSVKLMGSDNNPVMLNADTAPSSVYNYSLLQRLVDPSVVPNAEKGKPRVAIKEPIDIAKFKKEISDSPTTVPKMGSLGIGYILKMHQAWIPNGFSLGNLLYSLILAPGEEQRLIVRETKQQYTIASEAEGTDVVDEDYQSSQRDSVSAALNYAVQEFSNANSEYYAKTKTKSYGGGASGGLFGGMGSITGSFSGSTSTTTSNGSASAAQNNNYNEASNAAQNFQQSIKSSSEKLAQARRISITTAASDEQESVATKIIANHNHSHALTVQYWEVMRRYKLETCIDDVSLVLFIPLELIDFSTEQPYDINNPQTLLKRYEVIHRHATAFEYALPRKYRTGLNLLQRFLSLPKWTMEQSANNTETKIITLTVTGNFLPYDNLSATLVLKYGKGTVGGLVTNYRYNNLIQTNFESSSDLKKALRDIRKSSGSYIFECQFIVPMDISEDDLSYVRLNHSYDDFDYTLSYDYEKLSDGQKILILAALNYSNIAVSDETKKKLERETILPFGQNYSDFKIKGDINKALKMLPEGIVSPHVHLLSKEVADFGAPTIQSVSMAMKSTNGSKITITQNGNDVSTTEIVYQGGNIKDNLITQLSSSNLNSSVIIQIATDIVTLRFADLQRIEAMYQHVIENTLHYSQVIWASLSRDERTILLERYTIDMKLFDDSNMNPNGYNSTSISLLSCVNNMQPLGFYGNSLLLPFTMPKSLADKLGKTAGELQDLLYRYHTNSFRVPTTTISLPTDGMIGEAVLGETNVSEKIDLTRFWNWQDSPIDKMELNSSYLPNQNYLQGVTTKDIDMPKDGATAPTAANVPDLISKLAAKQAPQFNDITGLSQLKDILTNQDTNTAKGRDAVLSTNADMTKALVDYYKSSKEAEKAKYEAQIAALKQKEEKDKPKTDSKKGEDTNTTPTEPKTEPKQGEGASTPVTESEPKQDTKPGEGASTPVTETEPKQEPKPGVGASTPVTETEPKQDTKPGEETGTPVMETEPKQEPKPGEGTSTPVTETEPKQEPKPGEGTGTPVTEPTPTPTPTPTKPNGDGTHKDDKGKEHHRKYISINYPALEVNSITSFSDTNLISIALLNILRYNSGEKVSYATIDAYIEMLTKKYDLQNFTSGNYMHAVTENTFCNTFFVEEFIDDLDTLQCEEYLRKRGPFAVFYGDSNYNSDSYNFDLVVGIEGPTSDLKIPVGAASRIKIKGYTLTSNNGENTVEKMKEDITTFRAFIPNLRDYSNMDLIFTKQFHK